MKKLAKSISLLSVIITLLLGVFELFPPVTAAAIAYLVWSVSPYAFLAALINLVSNKPAERAALIITFLTCSSGIVLLMDALFFGFTGMVDLQDEAAFSVIPMWQWAGLLVVSLPLVILNKAKSM